MKYKEQRIDQKLRDWFNNDNTRALLRRVEVEKGRIRGLSKIQIGFGYPIAGIAGVNGAGKSTLLALVCCAFHNTSKGYRLPSRPRPYYTFRDFFIQHTSEIPPSGIEILYSIAYDKWAKTPTLPDGVGLGRQRRTKRRGGKWNDYYRRVKRNVAFIGVERVVPHYGDMTRSCG